MNKTFLRLYQLVNEFGSISALAEYRDGTDYLSRAVMKEIKREANIERAVSNFFI